MIVPMKKAAVIVLNKDAESAIKRLRGLGVLHLEHQQVPAGKDINAIHGDMALIDEAIRVLSAEELLKQQGGGLTADKELGDWRVIARHIVDLQKRADHLEEFLGVLINHIREWERWGDFEPEKIRDLAVNNIFLKLYQIPAGEINKLPPGLIVKTIFVSEGIAHCVVISQHRKVYNVSPEPPPDLLRKSPITGDNKLSPKAIFLQHRKVYNILPKPPPDPAMRGQNGWDCENCLKSAGKVIPPRGGIFLREEIELGFKEISLPQAGLEKMRARLSEDRQAIKVINGQLCESMGYREGLLGVRKLLEKELEFQEALNGMARKDDLMYLIGYAPYDATEALVKTAKQEQWGVFITEPSKDDNVPVLLRNPAWVSLITPLFKLLEVVPGYHELDVSPVFLLFLSLFFGMIIGDAGYGAVYFLLVFLSLRKFGNKVKDKTVFSLFFLFSSCSIIWGLLTGTVFGQQWYFAKGFKPFLPILNEAKFLMAFCFFLGAFQLSLAHGWQAIIKLPSLKALADAGFICLLWAGFFLAKMFILGDVFPVFGKWLIWAGILLIIFFSNPQKNIFRGIMEGMGVIALGLMGNFGDVVSYIRLFAVGLAGVAVADAVNTLAAGVGNNIAAQIIILFIGHTINMVLGPISVLVHGIRLNILEFSLLHGNITWSGLAYKPLRE